MWDTSEAAGYFNTTNGVDSPSKKQGQAKRSQSVVPVVIRQLRDCAQEEFKLFGMQTQILSIVAILREYEVQSTKATYTIEDHTGSMRAFWWLENDGDTPNLPPVREGRYLQVFGSLRTQDNERILMVLKMFPVEDPNVITCHLLQVIHTRLEAEALSKGTGRSTKVMRNNPGAELANSMSFMDDNMSNGNNMGLTGIQEKVFNIIQASSEGPAGIDKSKILNRFPGNQHREVNQAMDFLVNEGHIYSTIDNDHFKVTASM